MSCQDKIRNSRTLFVDASSEENVIELPDRINKPILITSKWTSSPVNDFSSNDIATA